MRSKMMSLNQIRKAGIEALAQTLGPVDMVRFLQQFDTGRGDYTKEREKWLSGMSLDDIIEGIEDARKSDKGTISRGLAREPGAE
jgi:hypothetical protein